MTDLPIRPGEEDDALAGEFVLGVLSAAEREACERRLARDLVFAALVADWTMRLSPLDDTYLPLHPSPSVKTAVETRLFGDAKKPGFWSNLWLWRGLAVASMAAVLLLSLIAVRQPEAGRLVATLTNPDTDLNLVALYDRNSAVLHLNHVAGDPDPDHDYELWVIAGDNPPASLGLVSATGQTEITVPEALRPHFSAEFALAISDEPAGGSPTGQATGPVIAVGQAVSI